MSTAKKKIARNGHACPVVNLTCWRGNKEKVVVETSAGRYALTQNLHNKRAPIERFLLSYVVIIISESLSRDFSVLVLNWNFQIYSNG